MTQTTTHDDFLALDRSGRFKFLLILWPQLTKTGAVVMQEKNYVALLDFMGQEFRKLQAYSNSYATQSSSAAINLVPFLLQHRTKSLHEVLSLLSTSYRNFDDVAIQRSLELAIRLWTTVGVDSLQPFMGPLQIGQAKIAWKHNESLDDLIHKTFDRRSPTPKEKETLQLAPELTVAKLVSICAVSLNWTDNLADHLVFNHKGRTLTVYRHKIWLLNYLQYPQNNILPTSVLEETIDSMNLLFPFGDAATKALLESEGQPFYSLGNCGREIRHSLHEYGHWRDRLLEISGIWEQPPRYWWQLIIDRRDMMAWATLWIAIVVLFLTLVSIAFGTVSSVYTIKQYNLAVAQACSAPDSARLLPRFCREYNQ